MHWFIYPLCDSCTYNLSSDLTCELVLNCFIQIVFNSAAIHCCQITLYIVKCSFYRYYLSLNATIL